MAMPGILAGKDGQTQATLVDLIHDDVLVVFSHTLGKVAEIDALKRLHWFHEAIVSLECFERDLSIDRLSASVYDVARKATSHLRLVLVNQYGQEHHQMFYTNSSG